MASLPTSTHGATIQSGPLASRPDSVTVSPNSVYYATDLGGVEGGVESAFICATGVSGNLWTPLCTGTVAPTGRGD